MSSDKNDPKGLLWELRRSQQFDDLIGVKKLILTVPIRRPNSQHFIQVHPSEDWRVAVSLLEDVDNRELYLVAPEILPAITEELKRMILFTTINRQGDISLWPVKIDKDSSKPNRWNQSALDVARLAMTTWIRIKSNMTLGAYEAYPATVELPEPEWPDITFDLVIEKAFKDRKITELDHPLVKKIRGEI